MGTIWSLKYNCCKNCGASDIKHRARGLCELCYQKFIETKHSPSKSEKSNASNILTKEFLLEHYCSNEESLSDIAAIAKCSRQYVFKKIKEFEIPIRNKIKARELALNRNKVKFERIDENGQILEITLSKSKVNDNFFKYWSPEMAYVLGIVCTDGNIRPSILRDPQTKDTIRISRLTISQKEPELLTKVLKLMDSEAKLLFRKRKEFSNTVSGRIFYFHLNSDEIYEDLIRLGLSANKSLTIKFPKVPEEHLNHFIRGCWDGDGSVYIDKQNNSISASFVSGSKEFIEELLNNLYKNGLPKRTLYQNEKSYYFRYTGNQCKLLAEFLYKNSNESMRLDRKYKLFQETK
jgi:hypothetical protein